MGGLGGAVGGHPIMGTGIGAGAGAVAGLVAVLLTRGPEAVLAKGTTMEMVLDRPLQFAGSELEFGNSMQRPRGTDGPGPLPSKKAGSLNRRFPL